MSPRKCSDVNDTQSAQLTVLHEMVNGCRWFGINVEHSLKQDSQIGWQCNEHQDELKTACGTRQVTSSQA